MAFSSTAIDAHTLSNMVEVRVTCAERLQPAVKLLLFRSCLRMHPMALLLAAAGCCWTLLAASCFASGALCWNVAARCSWSCGAAAACWVTWQQEDAAHQHQLHISVVTK
jgi:hypothetical protein